MRRIASLLPLLVTALTSVAPAQTTQPQTGQFHVTFTKESPLSRLDAQNRRYRLKVEPAQRYKLADESFEAFVPEDYDPAQAPYGLLVWCSSSKNGAPSKGWLAILTKYRLIWIGANGAGNERGIGARVGLSLDAVENFRAQYNIDEARIYAAGPSGGGKVASLLAIAYADVFSGALPIVGVSFYRAIPLPGRAGQVWPPVFERPAMPIMERAKTQNRFTLLTGSDDFNRDSVRGTYEQGFLADGFKYVDYIEVPAMGHGVPEAKWVEQAIGSLDAPLPALAKDQFNRAQQLDRSGRTTDALKLYQLAAIHLEEPLLAKAKARIADLEKRQPKPTTQPRH